MEPTTEHPAPWWYRLAVRLVPDRCREVPQPTDPGTVLIRQVALVKRYVYIQQFAAGEPVEWMHSHQWRRTVALGLWGSYLERRLGGRWWMRLRVAPYAYTMGSDVIHQVLYPSPGHTSIFVGLGAHDDGLKHYYASNQGKHWDDHIQLKVKRI